MIYDCTTQQQKNQKKKQKTIMNMNTYLSSKQYILLNKQQLKQFLDDHEIIHCIQHLNNYIENEIKCQKLMKLIFIIFQVAIVYGYKIVIVNFLKQYQFWNLCNMQKNMWSNRCQQMLVQKICRFLDSFKQANSVKLQLNALVKQYHEFRLLNNCNNSSFVIQACHIIKEYIEKSMNLLIKQFKSVYWDKMSNQVFLEFYKQQFGELCTICKRVSYIKSNLIALPSFQLPVQLRAKIEQKYSTIMADQRTNNVQIKCEDKVETQKLGNSTLNVKRKLKAVNHLISKMQLDI